MDPAAEHNRAKRVPIIIGIALGSFLAALDTTILSTVMPTIIGELRGLGLYSWVFSAYMISTAVSMPLWGRGSDILGRKPSFLAAVAVFLAGSALCGVAADIVQLILFRALQGIGAGGLAAVPFALISTVFPLHERGKALGFLTSMWGLAAIVGPILGSVLVTGLDWRWVFFINLPAGLLSLLLISRTYREDEVKIRERIDWLGAALLAVSIVSLLLVTLGVGEPQGVVATAMPAFGLLFAVTLAGFVIHERREEHPILAPAFFARRVFWLGNLLGFMAGFAMFGTIAYLPLLVQNLRDGGPLRVGVVMMAMSLGWSGASFIAGRSVHRAGENALVRAGIPLMLAGFLLGVFTTQDSPLAMLVAMAVLCGVGMGMQTPALLLAVQHSLEPQHIGIATSAQMLSRSIGGAVGVSVAGAAVALLMGRSLAGMAGRTGSPQELLGAEVLASLPGADRELVRAAFVSSIHAVFFIAIGVLGTALLLTVLLPPSSLRRADTHPATERNRR